MAASLHDLPRAEPSSDFPTDEDVSPCSFPRGASVVAIAVVVGVIAFLAGRAWTRRRRGP
ncbi:MAG TPA: hypothetical protein VF129_08335 [Actinomycetota bacterium]